jgi:hypothetical protein
MNNILTNINKILDLAIISRRSPERKEQFAKYDINNKLIAKRDQFN